MNLTYAEQLSLIDLTKTRLAKVCLYVAPARPCNGNRSWDNRDWGKLDGEPDKHNPCLRLVDKVGSSWTIRRASLLAVANRLPDTPGFTGKDVP